MPVEGTWLQGMRSSEGCQIDDLLRTHGSWVKMRPAVGKRAPRSRDGRAIVGFGFSIKRARSGPLLKPFDQC